MTDLDRDKLLPNIRLQLDNLGTQLADDRERVRVTSVAITRLALQAMEDYGLSKREVCRRLGISIPTLDRWLSRYARNVHTGYTGKRRQ